MRHERGHAHPAHKANPLNDDDNVGMTGDIYARVMGLTKAPGATPKSL